MSNNQQLFKDAIADAKTLREVAVANAKAALEESFMPRIQSMFERRVMDADELEEMKDDELDEKATYVVDKDNLIDSLDENEEMEEDLDLEELFNSLSEDEDSEGNSMYEMDSEMSEEDLEEDYNLEEILRELEEEDSAIYEGDDEDSMEEGTDEDLNENSMFEKASGGESIDEVTVDELRDMIQDAIRAVMGGEAGAAGDEEMDMDMDMGGAEGDDEFNLDIEDETEETEEKPKKKKSKEEELDELFALYERKKKEKEELDERKYKYKGGKDEKELDEAFDKKANAPFGLGKSKNKIGAPYGASGDKKSGLNGAYKNKLSMKLNEKVKEVDEAKKKEKEKELEEAINVIKSLRGQLNEVNLLNAKLIYVNKLFKASNLTENQKVNVVNSFDKAQTLTEAKNIYEVLKNTVKTSKVSSKTTLKEHKSFASSIVGGTTAKSPIISTDDQITRMQQLAGIITK